MFNEWLACDVFSAWDRENGKPGSHESTVYGKCRGPDLPDVEHTSEGISPKRSNRALGIHGCVRGWESAKNSGHQAEQIAQAICTAYLNFLEDRFRRIADSSGHVSSVRRTIQYRESPFCTEQRGCGGFHGRTPPELPTCTRTRALGLQTAVKQHGLRTDHEIFWGDLPVASGSRKPQGRSLRSGAKPEPSLCCSRSTFFCTLPIALRGKSATTSQCLGILKLARRDFNSDSSACASRSAPARATTSATPTSPKSGCATPITALSATPGNSFRTLSISAG